MSTFRLFDLNDPQLAAVRHLHGPLLILAGAGTGKTRVITARIAQMIHEGVRPDKILAVTFTNKAANEMRERVSALIPPEQSRQITLSTFHALCVRILRRDISRLGYKENFTIYDQGDQLGLIRSLIVRLASREEKLDAAAAQSSISRAKNDPAYATRHLAGDTLINAVLRNYQTELKRLNAVDFDDLLILAVQILRDHPEARAWWQEKFTHVMVDEFQDTNKLQLDLTAHLVGERRNIAVVGDDDQSIYGWRGADVTNILDFEKHFAAPKIVKLEQNYRSTNHILRTANNVIANNPRRRPKSLWSAHGDGHKVRLVPLPDDRMEADFVVSEISRLHHAETLDWSQFAILFRTNIQSRPLEEGLRRLKIPYKLIGGQSFFDRREIKDVLAYLKLLVNPDDDISLLRVINTPARGIGAAVTETGLELSRKANVSLHASLRDPATAAHLSARSRDAVAKFLDLVNRHETKMFSFGADWAAVFTAMIEESGYLPDLRKSCKTADEADARERNIAELFDSLREFQSARRKDAELQDFLADLTLDTSWDKDKKNEKDLKAVTLITLHAAKGLEYPHVFLVGLEEGILPHSRSRAEGTLDEERRLLYVGITRARQQLTLTYCQSRQKYGQKTSCTPSSFLKELPPAHIETVNFHAQMNAPVAETSARSHFSRMKELLAPPPAG